LKKLTSFHGSYLLNPRESKNDPAVLYKEQARYQDAKDLLLQVIEGRRLTLSDTHPHTIESLNNIVYLYEAWNKQEQAEE